MSELKMLAIDLGASSGRGIVGSFNGERLTLRENHRFSNDPVHLNGRMHWDILRIFHEIKQSISKTILEGDGISSIGIDSWGVDYALLDRSGRMLSNPVHYRDSRTLGVQKKISSLVSPEELYGVAGIQDMDFNTVYQLFIDREEAPERFALAARMLQIPDLLNYFLTDVMANEYTILSTGALLDAKKRSYATALLERLGLPAGLFGEITSPGSVLGGLSQQVQSETGKTDARVINVASHDTASAVLAVPTKEEDFIYISSGTWSLMGTELSEPLINDAVRQANFTNEGGALGKIRFLKNIMGLWILQESRRQWKREGKEYSYAQMEALAREAKPFQSLIDVDHPSFATPGNMSERIREFCRATGQHVPESVGEVVRCIYESLSLKYRFVVERIQALTGRSAKVIHVVGGGTKDHFLSQMTADACGIPVAAGPEEATAIGNLMMQVIAAGEVTNLAQAREIVAASFELKQYAPTADRGPWEEAYAKLRTLN
ncbi:MAG: rhamnulokinase [Ruminococcaceae bacterium]|nr:rhamnulokinase [Oscillospiraceae bacterium]